MNGAMLAMDPRLLNLTLGNGVHPMVNLSGLDYGLMHAIDPRLLNLTPMLNLKVGLDKLRDK